MPGIAVPCGATDGNSSCCGILSTPRWLSPGLAKSQQKCPWHVIYIPIMYAQRTARPTEINVVTIARSFCRSRTIPAMPNAKAAGNENMTSNAPSVAMGLPQPGWNRSSTTRVEPATISSVADIFPKRITQLSQPASNVNSGRSMVSANQPPVLRRRV